MKKSLLLIINLLMISSSLLFSQDMGMRYQAVARDLSGKVLANHPINLKVRLLSGNPDGQNVYTEWHQIRTNELGLFDLVIGEGQALNGDFREVPWSDENIWMELSIDETGGKQFRTLQASRLLAVPYAFHAGSARNLILEEDLEKSGNCRATGLPFWTTIGNYNIDAECHYIGTQNAVDVVFKTNGIERMRMLAGGGITFSTPITFKDDVTIEGNLTVFKNTNIGLDLKVDQKGTFGTDLSVGNDASVGHNLTVANDAAVNHDLTVNNAAAVTGNLNIGGVTTAAGQLNANGRLVVNGGASGDDENINSYPVLVQGSNQGIAVKVNGSRNNDNNYVSFWDNDGIQGRIEGQTLGEYHLDPYYIARTALLVALAAGEVAAVANPFEVGSIIAIGGELAYWTVDEVQADLNIGVAYESGSGDYAEWLERADPANDIAYAEVVGVKAGKISRKTEGADHLMVVSSSPIVLGNMPKDGREADFEKVAFMGQVLVRVIGDVQPGDYILPSGHNDGLAKAKSAREMKPADYRNIVGVAWGESSGAGLSLVNVAVGINANDLAGQVAQQQQRIDALEQKLNQVLGILAGKTMEDLPSANLPAYEHPNQAPAKQDRNTPTLSAADFNNWLTQNRELIESTFAAQRTVMEGKGMDIAANSKLKALFDHPVEWLLERFQSNDLQGHLEGVTERLLELRGRN